MKYELPVESEIWAIVGISLWKMASSATFYDVLKYQVWVKSITIFTILMNNSPQNFKENANVQSLSKRGSIYTIFLDFKFNTRPPSSTRKLMNIQHVTSDGKIFCDI